MFFGGHASNQARAVDRTDAEPGPSGHIQDSALTPTGGGNSMGESHPNQATTPDCQSLTEQPTKYLQSMGELSGLVPVVSARF